MVSVASKPGRVPRPQVPRKSCGVSAWAATPSEGSAWGTPGSRAQFLTDNWTPHLPLAGGLPWLFAMGTRLRGCSPRDTGFPQREWEGLRTRKMKATVSQTRRLFEPHCNLRSDIYPFCHILFIRIKSLRANAPHSRREDYTEAWIQEVGVVGGQLRGCLPHDPSSSTWLGMAQAQLHL